MTKKHTMGPWHTCGSDGVNVTIEGPCCEHIADVNVIHGSGCGPANVSLILAAPDLLAACEMVLDDPGVTASANDVLRAAIKKAIGGDDAEKK
jgi:hypothetical protein